MKNNYLILLILFLIWPVVAVAQTQRMAKGCVEYQADKTSGRRMLFFNETESLMVQSSTKLGMLQDESGAKIEEGAIRMSVTVKDEQGNQYYRNFNDTTLVVRHAKGTLPAYTYADSWIEHDWKTSNKTKTVGGLEVRKATTEFRGNTFEVWYAPEINLPYGPWKLFGLPGLIVEAKDKATGRMDYQLKSVHIPCPVDWPITAPEAEEQKTLKEHVDYRDNYVDHIHQQLISRLPPGSASRLTKRPTVTKTPRESHYEKIYEWETEAPDGNN